MQGSLAWQLWSQSHASGPEPPPHSCSSTRTLSAVSPPREPRGFHSGKQHRRGEQGNPTSSHRQEGSERWRKQELPAVSSQLLSLEAMTQPRGVPALAAPLHPQSTDLAAPTGASGAIRLSLWGQSVPAPQNPLATPPAPPCSTLGLMQQLPSVL